MGWSLRVLRHRAAAQRTLLATVVAVALIGASPPRHLRPPAVHQRAPRPRHRPRRAPRRRPPTSTWTSRSSAAARSSPPTPARRSSTSSWATSRRRGPQWLTSPMYRLTGEDGYGPAAWPTSPTTPTCRRTRRCWRARGPPPATDDAGRVAGRRPEGRRRAVRLDRRHRAARCMSLDHVRGQRGGRRRDPRARRAAPACGPVTCCSGAEHDPRYPVPGSFGFLATDAWGPFVVAPGALTDPGLGRQATLVASPQLADSPPGAVDALRGAARRRPGHPGRRHRARRAHRPSCSAPGWRPRSTWRRATSR